MGRKKPAADEPMGCPDWMVTFSDVVSLLVTFFVLMLTFSTLEEQELMKASGSLQGAFGAMTPEFVSNRGAVAAKQALHMDRQRDRGLQEPFVRDLEDLEDELEDLMMQHRLGEEIQIDKIKNGLRIRVAADRLFNPGSDEIRSGFKPVISNLGNILRAYPNEVMVEGHTDSTFVGTSSDATVPEGYELAGTMARKVAEALTREGAIQANKVGAASFGPSRPIAANDSAGGRARNRRVDILIFDNNSGN